MAKKKAQTWGVEQIDELMDAMFDEAKRKFGDDTFYTGRESEQLIIGLPLPALSLRYLFQSNVFPLSRLTVLTGQQGSAKSAMLYEIFRWHRASKGRNVLLECESKDSPELRASILNYDSKACGVKLCESLNQWQEGLTWVINENQRIMTGTSSSPGPGRIIPICVGIDSLMAKASQENIDKMIKEGHADRAHPLEALMISQFMKVWPQKLIRWPFSVVATNHLKPTKDFMGRPGRNIPGGMAPKFQETYEVEMAFLRDIRTTTKEGLTVSLLLRKNSLGPSRKQITADLVWWYEEVETGDPDNPTKTIQRTKWDWNTSSINLLLEIQNKNKMLWKKISEHLDLNPVRGKGLAIWSEALNIPEDEPVSYERAGEILESRPDVLKHVESLLGVRERFIFTPGVDFEQQIEAAKQKALEHPDLVSINTTSDSSIEEVNVSQEEPDDYEYTAG